VLAVLSVVFLYYFAMRQAIGDADQDKVTALRLMGAGRARIIRLLTLPEATPHLLGATRSALPIGFAAVVFAEIRVSATSSGLGQLLERYIGQLDGNGSVAVVVLIGIVGFLLDLLIGRRIVRFTRDTGTGIEPG
jgi:ABC-type nitrate/sulfonate/bicarbonate transport system permease component